MNPIMHKSISLYKVPIVETNKEEINQYSSNSVDVLGVTQKGRAIRFNLFFVPQKRISTSIPNAKIVS